MAKTPKKKRQPLLRELRIDRFRSVTPGTRLVFDREWNVLLGKNGSGKTTLLCLTEAIFSGNFEPFLQDDMKLSFDMELEGLSITTDVECVRDEPAPRPSDPTVEAMQLRSDGKPRRVLRFTVTLSKSGRTPQPICTIQSNAGRGRVVLDGNVIAFTSTECNWIESVLDLAMSGAYRASKETALLPIFALWELQRSRRFDESITAFEALTTRGRLKLMRWNAPERVHVYGDVTADLDAAAQKKTSSASLAEPGEMSFDSQEVGFLATFLELWGGHEAKLILPFLSRSQKKAPGPDDVVETSEYGPFTFRFTQSDGSIFSHSNLSYGQKRLLAFLHYTASSDGPIIADELVNGLHYDWIERCVEVIDGRQKFLTSQNPLLLDHLKFSSATEVRERFITCESKDGAMTWNNLSSKQADGFFDSYLQGIQYVGEILRAQRLW
jgi:energy-coupling factor transporter ATP-binding protein EcfA2